ncbi:hypothetical protein [Nonomuraea sp. NPDC049158]|uniref:hypothetical protein n=1 Tax=Nonomuraea sp. NPDC049158 TaxID=3155649 RepID=UPI0033E23DA6
MTSNKPDFITLVLVGAFSLALAACDAHGQMAIRGSTSASPSGAAVNAPSPSPSVSATGLSTTGATPDPNNDSPVLNMIQERGGGSLAAPRGAMAYSDNPRNTTVVVPQQEGSDYWGTDWCHYFYRQARWYGDLCLRQALAGNGQALTNIYNFYLYQPGTLGQLVLQADFNDPRWRVISSPLFPMSNVVHWLAWPTAGEATANTLWLNMTDYQQNQNIWLPYQKVAAEIRAGNGSRFGIQANQPPQDLSAWAWGVSTFTSMTNAIGTQWTAPQCAASYNGCGTG